MSPVQFSTLRVASLALSTLIAPCVVSCQGGGDSQPTIVGDWFMCRNESCSRLEEEGVRFQADGVFLNLQGDTDDWKNREPVCASLGQGSGTYEFEGGVLTASFDRETQTFDGKVEGDRLLMTPTGARRDSDDTELVMQRVRVTLEARCNTQREDDSEPPQVSNTGAPMRAPSGPIKPAPPGDGPIVGGQRPAEPEVDGGAQAAADGGTKSMDAGMKSMDAGADGGTSAE